MNDFPNDIVDLINDRLGGYNNLIGLAFTKASADEFCAEIQVDERHLQPYGLVHGGIYSSMIETVCSTAAALNVFAENKSAVGLENSISFLRAVRNGTLRCTATPSVKGGRTHVWEGRIFDQSNRLVAIGRVRILILEKDSRVKGVQVKIEGDP